MTLRTAPAALAFLLVLTGGLAGCQTGSLSEAFVPLSDASPLSNDVRAALRASPETMHSNILVKSVGEGRVRLSGALNSESLVNTAEQIARQVPGVTGVINTLQIR